MVAKNQPSGSKVVAKQQLDVKSIKLYDCGGDTSKRWFITYNAITQEGTKRKQLNLPRGAKTAQQRYAAAHQIIEGLKAEIETVAKQETTLLEALNEAIAYKADYITNPRTLSGYRLQWRMLTQYLTDTGQQKMPLWQCDEKFIERYMRDIYMRKRKVSKVSYNTYATHLRALFTIVQKLKDHPNPFAAWEPLRADEAELKIWPDHLIAVLSQHLKENNQPLHLAVLLVFHSFLRPVELTRLQIADFDTQKGIVHVAASKGKSNRRKTPSLSEPARLIIEVLKSQYPPNYYLFGQGLLPGPNPHNPDYISKQFAKVRKELGIPARHKLYNFKHTGNSKFLTDGISIHELMLQNGHQEERTTRRYAKQLYAVANDTFRFKAPEF